MLGKIEGMRKRGQQRMMVGWHHWLNGHEFEQTPWDSGRQGSLACSSPWSCRGLTWLSNWTKKFLLITPLDRRCFWTVLLEKTVESSLDYTQIKPGSPKGSQSWIFIGRTDAEAEAPILWSPDAKSWCNGKDPDAGKDWRQEEKGMTEDEMVGRDHCFDGHEFEQAPGFGDGQRNLACYSPWGLKSWTWLSNWTELIPNLHSIDEKTNAQKGSWAFLGTLQQAVELGFEPKKSASRTPDF